jgi:hypothetical protein
VEEGVIAALITATVVIIPTAEDICPQFLLKKIEKE